MSMWLKIIEIGDEAGIILPQELLDHLGVGIGDDLTLIDTPRGFELRASKLDAHILPVDSA